MASPDTIVSTVNLLRRLKDQGVEFVVIGGVAANVHGSPRDWAMEESFQTFEVRRRSFN